MEFVDHDEVEIAPEPLHQHPCILTTITYRQAAGLQDMPNKAQFRLDAQYTGCNFLKYNQLGPF